jgi:hypothetical protein
MAIAEVASGATYYLDAVGGNDSNPGTGEQPWKTLAKAQSVAVGGDSVYMRNGDYGDFLETTTVRTDWVTYKADTGQTDVNFASIKLGQWDGPFNKYLIFDGIKVSPGVLIDDKYKGIYVVAADHLKFRNMSIYKGGGHTVVDLSAGIWAQYSDDIEVNNVTIYGLPTGTDYEGGYARGIYNICCNDVTITDCNIMNITVGIITSGVGLIIRRNDIHESDVFGMRLDGTKNAVIEDNHIYNIFPPVYVKDKSGSSYDNATKTITAGSGTPYANVKTPGPVGANSSVRITDGGVTTAWSYIVSHTDTTMVLDTAIGQNYSNIDLVEVKEAYHTDGIQGVYSTAQNDYVRSQNVIIRRNRIHDIEACGMRFQFSVPDPSYPFWEPACDWIVENNLIYNIASEAFSINSIEDINICNNTFLDGPTYLRFGTKPNFFANNIMDTICFFYTDDPPVLDPNYEDYNLARYWPVEWGRNGAHDVDMSDADFTALFADAANHDYNLAPGSVAINFGNPNYGPSTDILRRSRVGAPDAGCYEYHGPVLGSIGDKSVHVNESLNFTVSATDPDADPITYSAQNLPSGATFQGQTFSWTPTGGQVGTYQVTFIASDGSEQDSETITITVKSTNQAPTANAGPDQTAIDSDGNGSQQVTLNGSGSTDSDGTIQSYVWSEGGTQIATGVNPTVTLAVGQHTITLTVTDDGGLTDTDTVAITVSQAASNQPPNANAGADQTITDDDGNGSEQVTLNGSGSSDPGGAIQSYVWSEGGAQIATGMNPTVTPAVGQHTITLTVTDNGGLTDTDTVMITINPINDNSPPSVTNYSPAPDSIQVPLNNLITLHIVDAGKGVDANSVTVKVNNNTVYSGNTVNYTSATGNCRRIGTKSDYTFTYQPNEMFDFEQKLTVAVNAADLGGNVMPEYTYSFWTEMRSFGKNKRVSLGLDNLGSAAPATVRDSSGNVWAVWHAGPVGARAIYLSKLVNEAANFTGSIQLIADPADQCNPAIALGSSDKLYVVWQDNRRGNWDVYVSTSVDGVSWSAERLVTDSNDNQINPAVAIDGSSPSRAYIVWQDDRGGNQDIYVASSSDGFATKAISQITANASDQTDPAIAADSANTVYVVWTDKRNGSTDIYGAASNSGPWTNVPIVNKAGNQSSPAIAAETAGSILHLLWVDDASGNSDIYHAATNGLPSSPVTGGSIMDDSSGRNQVEPVIAVTGSTGNNLEIFACWQDRRNVADASADTDLYFAEVSSDGGTNVFVGDDSTNSNQSQPAIGVDAQGHPYLVWSDSRSANSQIYYAGNTYLDSEAVDSELVAASAGATVGVNPASIDSVDDVSVTVPAGACPCDIQITISEIKNPQEFTVPCLAAYDFGPSSLQFNQPVTITMPYAISGTGTLTTPYWFNSLTGALSQQGITDIKDIVISPTLHALSFKTTHFTPFYVVEGTAGGTGGGGGGGCSVSATGNGSTVEFLLPYIALAAVMMILKLHDTRERL